jgi:hypothetical protein
MWRIRALLRLIDEGETIERSFNMKYILRMNCPRNGYESIGSWPQKDIQAHIGFLHG